MISSEDPFVVQKIGRMVDGVVFLDGKWGVYEIIAGREPIFVASWSTEDQAREAAQQLNEENELLREKEL